MHSDYRKVGAVTRDYVGLMLRNTHSIQRTIKRQGLNPKPLWKLDAKKPSLWLRYGFSLRAQDSRSTELLVRNLNYLGFRV